jgi:hypothetical protein
MILPTRCVSDCSWTELPRLRCPPRTQPSPLASLQPLDNLVVDGDDVGEVSMAWLRADKR